MKRLMPILNQINSPGINPQTMYEIALFKQFPSTKAEIQTYFEGAKASILSGNQSSLELFKHIKAFEDLIEQILKDVDIKKAVLREAETYGEKTFDVHGCKFQIRGKTDYIYTFCDDPELKQLEQEQLLLKTKIDARKTFLKTLKEPYADRETGEIIKPASNKYTESVTITLK
jgi:hypothetical protein